MDSDKSINSIFLQKYLDDSVHALHSMNPEWEVKDLEIVVTEEMEKSFSNPSVSIENSFTNQRGDTTLLTIFDWIEQKKPIIAGNGTLYKNQYEAVNPIANMLMNILAKRKEYKNEMFKVGEPTSRKYKDLDLKQAIQKVNANS